MGIETGWSCVKGIGVSPGIVVGVAHRVQSVLGSLEQQNLASPRDVPAEIERFDRAVAETGVELETIVQRVAKDVGESAADIFKSHIQILHDPALVSKVHNLIEGHQLTALSALQVVMNHYTAQFARIQQDFFRERMIDIQRRDPEDRVAPDPR